MNCKVHHSGRSDTNLQDELNELNELDFAARLFKNLVV
jgi:hypothetical protein